MSKANISNPRRLHTLSIIQALFTLPSSVTRNSELQSLLSDFQSSSRGKDKFKPFIKSVALSRYRTNFAKPHSGKQEAARNLASGKVRYLDYNAARELIEERRTSNSELYGMLPSSE